MQNDYRKLPSKEYMNRHNLKWLNRNFANEVCVLIWCVLQHINIIQSRIIAFSRYVDIVWVTIRVKKLDIGFVCKSIKKSCMVCKKIRKVETSFVWKRLKIVWYKFDLHRSKKDVSRMGEIQKGRYRYSKQDPTLFCGVTSCIDMYPWSQANMAR